MSGDMMLFELYCLVKNMLRGKKSGVAISEVKKECKKKNLEISNKMRHTAMGQLVVAKLLVKEISGGKRKYFLAK